MASEISTQQRTTAVSAGEKITYSADLIAAIEQQKNSPDSTRLPYLPRAVVAEARCVAEAMQSRYLAPAEEPERLDFLNDLYDELNAIVCNPANEASLALRKGIASEVMADMPRRVFGGELKRACFARFKFLPAPAELLEIAQGMAQEWRDKTAQVKMIVTNDECKRFTLGYAPDREEHTEQAPAENVQNILHAVGQCFQSRRAQDEIVRRRTL